MRKIHSMAVVNILVALATVLAVGSGCLKKSSNCGLSPCGLGADGSSPCSGSGGCPYANGGGEVQPGPYQIFAIHQSQKFAYFVHPAMNGFLYVYNVDQATGRLVINNMVQTIQGADALVINPNGKFVHVSSSSKDLFATYSINQENGSLGKVEEIQGASKSGPVFLLPTLAGYFMYSVNLYGGSISVYRGDADRGSMSQQDIKYTKYSPMGPDTDSQGRFMYVPSFGASYVHVYSINGATGQITETQVADNGAGTKPIFVKTAGQYLYVSNFYKNTLNVMRRDPGNGSLSLASTVNVGSRPSHIALGPDGAKLYVVAEGAGTVTAFGINQASGALGSLGTKSAGSLPISVVIHPAGKAAYVMNFQSVEIQTFGIDASGALGGKL